jgi:crotonobetainyl-CoA:carnitine CoA-transferase CaiB-like acyl-CoA transferase
MGALMERARTGKGQVVDIAMIETAMPFAMAGFGLAFGGQRDADPCALRPA